MEPDQPVLENAIESAASSSSLNGISTPSQTDPADGRITSFGESVFSGQLDDNAVASVMKDNQNESLPHEPLSNPDGLRYDSRLSPTALFESRQGNSPREWLHQSPGTGQSVDQSKKYIKDKPADLPVDESTSNASAISKPAKSPTRKGRDAKGSKTDPPMGDGSSSPQGDPNLLIAPKFPSHWKRRRARRRRRRAARKRRAAKRRLEKEAAEATERTRVAAEETARKEVKVEEEKRVCRRIPMGELIRPLDTKWEQIVYNAMATPRMQEVLVTTSNGCKLTRRDVGTLKVVTGRDPPRGWLNDEIISACLQHVVDYSLRKSNHKVGETPKYHAFNTFFYSNLREKGTQSIGRWANRAKIGKENLLKVERLFIPVHSGQHWSLIVVSPIGHTIGYFDSLRGPARPYIINIIFWLRAELGKLFKEEEWTVPTGSVGAGPQQSNDSDCGVFTYTNAKMVLLGLNPMQYDGSDCEIQRTRMVAELLNGGLNGDFEPEVIFYSASPEPDGNDGQYDERQRAHEGGVNYTTSYAQI